MKNIINLMHVGFFLSLSSSVLIAGNLPIAITPYLWSLWGVAAPKSIAKNQTTNAYYYIKNNSTSIQKGNFIRYLPPNVIQVTKGGTFYQTCGTLFDLGNSDQSNYCILQLKVFGAVDPNDPDPKHHLTICQNESDCIVVDENYELNVVVGKPNIFARTSVVNLQNLYVDNDGRSISGPISYTSTDGGVSWVAHRISDSRGFVRAMTCNNNSQRCVAVGDSYESGTQTAFFSYTSLDGGNSWLSHQIEKHGGASGLSAVTCSDNNQNCVAVGGAETGSAGTLPIVYTSSDSGNSWVSHYPIKIGKFMSSLRAISCTGKKGQYCVAVGDSHDSGRETTFISYSSTDGGNSWGPANIMESHSGVTSLLRSISCNRNNSKTCVVVGSLGSDGNNVAQPIIYTTKNGGVNWKSYRPQQGIGGILNDVRCGGINDQYCMAVGGFYRYSYSSLEPIVYLSSDGGDQWSAREFFGGVGRGSIFTSLACSDTDVKYCSVIGYRLIQEKSKIKTIPIIYTTADRGDHWYWRAFAFANDGDELEEIETFGISISGE